jgi:hypothetical protein
VAILNSSYHPCQPCLTYLSLVVVDLDSGFDFDLAQSQLQVLLFNCGHHLLGSLGHSGLLEGAGADAAGLPPDPPKLGILGIHPEARMTV